MVERVEFAAAFDAAPQRQQLAPFGSEDVLQRTGDQHERRLELVFILGGSEKRSKPSELASTFCLVLLDGCLGQRTLIRSNNPQSPAPGPLPGRSAA